MITKQTQIPNKVAMFGNLLKWFTRRAGKEKAFVRDEDVKEIPMEELFSIKKYHLSLFICA